MSKRIVIQVIPWVIPLLLLIIWQLASQFEILPARILPAPSEITAAAYDLVHSGEIWPHLWASTHRAVIGLLIGGGIGFIFGLINGLSKISAMFFDSSIQMLRNIPHLALIPLIILWFGIGEEGKIFLIALGVMFPIYLNTFHGIRSVDKDYIEMGNNYGLSNLAAFWHIILPGALPSILVGLRYALGIMWVTLIVAETIAANDGIGFLAMDAREFMQMDVVVLSIILYALLGKLSDMMAKTLEFRFLKWHLSYQK
ncbi:alkanesulfonate transporter permease subunit [Shouchella clausii]|uniref:Alkanesulfonate transporter permease subunit n=2 Tax=Shouchella clausii TaxID=79880 RepID=A0A268S166_SHOCL|nr:ABC transporter permease subunit [Shouchella clausii]MBU8596107.1 ABC transporter permease subunit [Shouchella clausii]MED4159792.1 ABC transporter permease subunit [Shouchella clausii]MED4177844.1 ABC transporter permease subunit [Shouchella clausii]PAD09799.1 alkanesulfonate transporter permease subunit [Shouchella clausii]PAD12596.1 alkanesulfonate transporter permease subunit [Shouchella clausii]